MTDSGDHRLPSPPLVAIAVVQGRQVNHRYSTSIPDKVLLPVAE